MVLRMKAVAALSTLTVPLEIDGKIAEATYLLKALPKTRVNPDQN
jgi:hypothetical protein